jgi:hypothetical protein
MTHIRLLVSMAVIVALTLVAPQAHAATTDIFATNVSISPDGGRFWQGTKAGGYLQGTMQIEWLDNGDGTYTLQTGSDETFLWSGNDCTAANNGPGCGKFFVLADHPTSVTFDGAWWHISFALGLAGSGVGYTTSLTLGQASYLGPGGATLSGFVRSDSHNSDWMGASGKLCINASSCS